MAAHPGPVSIHDAGPDDVAVGHTDKGNGPQVWINFGVSGVHVASSGTVLHQLQQVRLIGQTIVAEAERAAASLEDPVAEVAAALDGQAS